MTTLKELANIFGKKISPATKGDIGWRHDQTTQLLQMCHWRLEQHTLEISKLQSVISEQQATIAAQNDVLSQLVVSGTPILAGKFIKNGPVLTADAPYPIFCPGSAPLGQTL